MNNPGSIVRASITPNAEGIEVFAMVQRAIATIQFKGHVVTRYDLLYPLKGLLLAWVPGDLQPRKISSYHQCQRYDPVEMGQQQAAQQSMEPHWLVKLYSLQIPNPPKTSDCQHAP